MKNILTISLLSILLFSCKSDYECTSISTSSTSSFTTISFYENMSASEIRDIETYWTYSYDDSSSDSLVTTCEKID